MAISIRATGAYVNGTANLTPVIPAGAVAGDMMICAVATKPYNGVNSMSSGWVSIGSATDGTVASGIDVGSVKTELFYKEHTGTESNPTVTNASNSVSGAVIIVFQKASDKNWDVPVGSGGGDATAGTGFSVSTGSIAMTSGDMLVAYAGIRSDAGTQSSISMTAVTVTIGAFTESPTTDLATTSGDDMAMSGGYAAVTAGTATESVTYTSTLAASHTGSAFVSRLREVDIPAGSDPLGRMGFFGL